MAVASKLQSMGKALKQMRRIVSLTLSGSYSTGGDTVDLTQMTNPQGIDGGRQFSRKPKSVEVTNGPVAFVGHWVDGTDNTNGKLQITSAATGAELAAGAYPAALTGADAFKLEVIHTALV